MLHNIVGGHLGVFEGNGGDLRIGLSTAIAARWRALGARAATARVFIEAPRAAIDRVLDKHAHVQALVDNGWLSLFQLDEQEGAIYAFRGGRWQREGAPTEFVHLV